MSSVYFQVFFAGCVEWCDARIYIGKFLFMNALKNKLCGAKARLSSVFSGKTRNVTQMFTRKQLDVYDAPLQRACFQRLVSFCKQLNVYA